MTTVHFAHANGFPAGSYQTLFTALPSDWTILAKPQFGHNQAFPVSNNWTHQGDELLAYVTEKVGDTPVYLVGHSFGAVLSYISACGDPERVKGVIMLDPPLIYGPTRFLLQGAKILGLMDKITPAKLAKLRRTHWCDDDDIVGYFASKKLFKEMDKRCIKDYVASGTAVKGTQRKLTFSRHVEADIFRHLPHNLRQYRGKLSCPGHIIVGAQSDVTRKKEVKLFARHNHLQVSQIEGGHMFVLEQPEAVAAMITATINRWEETIY
ncbi:alpha/beta hydrolase [Alteromonas sp. C1M14]|uniref:alpha/beta fold hydrolase n=1 Tax=Alteromonas sp. C1M14 TaxID=2841567 RepID=UPI001C08208F|nr:alpha/beta hydrolase [Alteromonas sp. C1M14]